MNCIKSKSFYSAHLPPDLPVFYKPFYLEVVTRGNWEVSCLCEDEKILVSMPYAFVKGSYKTIRQPPFAIYQGPYFTGEYHRSDSLTHEMEMLEQLELSLPAYDYYNQNWHPSARNWLPFYWKGYHQSSRYSYIIGASQQMENVRAGYNENVRRNLRKSSAMLEVQQTALTDGLFTVIGKTFDRKSMSQPYDFVIFKDLVQACHAENCCSITLAKDSGGNIHAGMFIVWDQKWVYYIAGGIDQKYKNSGAMTLLFDRAIEFAMTTGRSFDFEGSMIKSIEKYFRSFGAVQQEYFVITRATSSLLRLRLALARTYPVFHPF